ncbi:MAG TPA: hypothetical protein VEA99_03585 [Gemmatimonadaceae bacterium]|nr:hypothetical protein [Gemmatimonadaceae bacterium]
MTTTTFRAFAVLALSASTALAQNADKAASTEEKKGGEGSSAPTPAVNVFKKTVTAVRPYDQRGLNTFEMPKPVAGTFSGPSIDIGAAFTQQFQSLKHENAASPRMVGSVDKNKLIALGAGFNLASANLSFNANLAPGIVVALENYMSSRGHNEFYVKGGYLQVDESPIKLAPLQKIFEYTTIKVGHFENNYGDAHFRRTDNGQAMYNPFVGNYIVDAFTTELGGEVYVRKGAVLLMGGLTSGEVKGAVADPEKRGWARYGKLALDKQVNSDLRLRLSGSAYKADRSLNQTIFSGDRAGSRYYDVVVDSVGRDRWSGTIQPGFRSSVQAMQINPFVKFKGLEVFGLYETGKGKAATETANRDLTQKAADVVYRFLDDKLYVGGRYNEATVRLQGFTNDVSADRQAFAAGWFISPLVLLKGEYVNQKYNDFPTTDRRSGGKFKGFVVEGVVAF